MNILVDIGHPAHVHYYRNLATALIEKGHKVVFTVKDIEIATMLLNYYGFSYTTFPSKKDGLFEKVIRQMQYNWKLFRICKRERIDIAIGTSVSIAHVSRITSIKSIIFDDDDDDVQPLITKYVHPYADVLISPEALKFKRKRKDTIYYPGTHELAYLHPSRFTPDRTVLHQINIGVDEKFFMMRFNAFKAHHDKNAKGLSLKQKLKIIEILKSHGKILITTEREIEPELKEFQLKASIEKIHSLMAYSTIFIGDSQTMTAEAAVLGVPSLRCNSFVGRLSCLEELEHRFQLTYAFSPSNFEEMLEKLKELLLMPNLKDEWQKRRENFLNAKIDVTAFWVWLINNYPESLRRVEDKEDFWEQFK